MLLFFFLDRCPDPGIPLPDSFTLEDRPQEVQNLRVEEITKILQIDGYPHGEYTCLQISYVVEKLREYHILTVLRSP